MLYLEKIYRAQLGKKGPHKMNSKNKTPTDLVLLANLMDAKFKGPFGLKFGLDGLIGLIPIFGDLTTAIVSIYIILRAALMKAPLSVILFMLLNVLFEFTIGLIPIVGDLFDFFWKANIKNINLLSKWLDKPQKTKSLSLLKIGLALFTIVFVFGSVIYLIFSLLRFLVYTIAFLSL